LKTRGDKGYIYIKRNPKNNRSEKRIAGMPEKMPKLVEEIKKCKRLKLTVRALLMRKKVQNQMFMDSIKFYLRFN
jgi:hypothetical protein